jgi:hypothetical protein
MKLVSVSAEDEGRASRARGSAEGSEVAEGAGTVQRMQGGCGRLIGIFYLYSEALSLRQKEVASLAIKSTRVTEASRKSTSNVTVTNCKACWKSPKKLFSLVPGSRLLRMYRRCSS